MMPAPRGIETYTTTPTDPRPCRLHHDAPAQRDLPTVITTTIPAADAHRAKRARCCNEAHGTKRVRVDAVPRDCSRRSSFRTCPCSQYRASGQAQTPFTVGAGCSPRSATVAVQLLLSRRIDNRRSARSGENRLNPRDSGVKSVVQCETSGTSPATCPRDRRPNHIGSNCSHWRDLLLLTTRNRYRTIQASAIRG